jgi:hypothetical protein
VALLRIRFPFTMANGKTGSFAMWFETINALAASERLSVVNAASVEWLTRPSLFCPDVTLGQARIQGFEWVSPGNIDPTTVEQLTTSVPSAIVGTAAGESSPPQISYVVTFRTDLPGGRNRGRIYTPPPPESQVTASGGIGDAATRALWIQEVAEAAEGALVPVNVDHVVLSSTYGSTEQVTQYVGRSKVDTQRRRRSPG